MKRLTTFVTATAALFLLVAGPGVSSVGAQTSAGIEITAIIGLVPSLGVDLCDASAQFGENLTNHGMTPGDADPYVWVTSEGSRPGEGVFYIWYPGPQCGGIGVSANGNVDFRLSWCATENGGEGASRNVTIADGDLRMAIGPYFPFPDTYDAWLGQPTLRDCDQDPHTLDQTAGWVTFDFELGLRVDDGDEYGSFHSVLTFSVAPS